MHMRRTANRDRAAPAVQRVLRDSDDSETKSAVDQHRRRDSWGRKLALGRAEPLRPPGRELRKKRPLVLFGARLPRGGLAVLLDHPLEAFRRGRRWLAAHRAAAAERVPRVSSIVGPGDGEMEALSLTILIWQLPVSFFAEETHTIVNFKIPQ